MEQRAPFADRLAALVDQRGGAGLCVGLDPVEGATGGRTVEDWCNEVVAGVADHAVAVKPQLACFEALGPERGWAALERVCARALRRGLLVIADGKRGDVPSTAVRYAEAAFGWLGADAATVSPYLGADALVPWVDAAAAGGRGLFVLVATSNPGAGDLQGLRLADGTTVAEHVARMAVALGHPLDGPVSGLGGLGLVVGATAPDRFAALRAVAGRAVFLMPGLGAQGAAPEDLRAAAGPHPAAVLAVAARSVASAHRLAGDPHDVGGAAAAAAAALVARLRVSGDGDVTV